MTRFEPRCTYRHRNCQDMKIHVLEARVEDEVAHLLVLYTDGRYALWHRPDDVQIPKSQWKNWRPA